MNSNRYNSIRETFTSDPILSATLSTLCAGATPPGDMNLTNASFTAKQIYPQVATAGGPFSKFAINDHPRIVGIGLFCNMADGLVNISPAETYQRGIIMSMGLGDYTALGVLGAVIDSLEIKIPELNQVFDMDYLTDVAAVNVAQDSLRIAASVSSSVLNFSTITINPSFATKIITFRPVFVIEHTFPVTQA